MTMTQVSIPHDYFLNMSKKDYRNYKSALIREFIQNSIDAKAKQIVIDIDSVNNTITVFDDGHGMTKDIILNKLLCLGESHKNNDNAVGAFGHAKLLLYFSWEKWEIQSLDNHVIGESHYYRIEKNNDYVKGTISHIKVTENIISSMDYIIPAYLDNCETDCNIYVYFDGSRYYYNKERQTLNKGECIYESKGFNVYKGDSNSYYAVIRQNGICMFTQYSGKKDITPIIEINISPYEILLQNRDYFKPPYDDELNNVINQLSTDDVNSFALNNEKREVLKVNCNNNDIYLYDIGDNKPDEILKLRRNRRILAITKAYYEYMKANSTIIPDNINFGLIFRDDVHGLYKSDNTIFINPDYIRKHSPDYRHMAIQLYNTFIHELSHAITFKKEGSIEHNEQFSKIREYLVDVFWNHIPFVKLFKEVWKETK